MTLGDSQDVKSKVGNQERLAFNSSIILPLRPELFKEYEEPDAANGATAAGEQTGDTPTAASELQTPQCFAPASQSVTKPEPHRHLQHHLPLFLPQNALPKTWTNLQRSPVPIPRRTRSTRNTNILLMPSRVLRRPKPFNPNLKATQASGTLPMSSRGKSPGSRNWNAKLLGSRNSKGRLPDSGSWSSNAPISNR